MKLYFVVGSYGYNVKTLLANGYWKLAVEQHYRGYWQQNLVQK